ncbi:MAG: hypothetical protein F9K30_08585 [Dechloromonas sp.]|nr:MAG: hypothetical protein F9K30_08585 [Dechloromonas sp.]
MGQAKKRGSHEQRVLAAKARTDALRPASIICNDCKSEITEIVDLNIRGMEGIEAAFAGHCHKCNSDTYAVKGQPDSVEALMMALTEANGNEPLLGIQ